MGGWGTEHGPYVIDETYTTFHYNQYSWNQFANVMYLESPGGVGYSTCDSVTDCTFDDDSSADDNLRALVYFFGTLFPEYLGNELYLTGESYAGIYVPYLLDRIHVYNQDETNPIHFNLKGFMVGNGCTNWNYDTTPAGMQMTYWHGFYSDTIHDIFEENDCYDQFTAYSTETSLVCLEAFIEYENQMTYTNPYNLYGPCSGAEPDTLESPNGVEENDGKPKVRKARLLDKTPWYGETKIPGREKLMQTVTCTYDDALYNYMNLPEVRTALHIPSNVHEWTDCTNRINYHNLHFGSQWVYEKYHGQYRMLHFSGDADSVVATWGTLEWIEEFKRDLRISTVVEWMPYYFEGQVAGYYEQYEGDFAFATVHGAGHMVPMNKPGESFVLFQSWLKGELPPSNV
eukprot:CAMPEP_0170543952 /NCGR_PEP_ID=MMETSP0211-20121228/2893_1 /TAXON_ID=311385 /ORGANISM="Pseudokeronopsis sp., Strain OXSARD2" /LENGTH=400 /DNA_ID=CAMNT_0010847485 /DNA_START=251 /DNA_END=1453 /DNA_ORIENTATION=+